MTMPRDADTMTLPFECPNCGAAVTEHRPVCAYCGTVLGPERLAEFEETFLQRAPGFRGRGYLALGFLAMAALYIYGWRYEDTQYWLDERAMTVWTALMPLLAFVWTVCWKPRWGSVLLGLLAGAAVFFVHLGAMAAIDGRIRDDHVGIAALVAGALAAGWFAGRGLRRLILRAEARAAFREAGGRT